jgi:hypothetical protein
MQLSAELVSNLYLLFLQYSSMSTGLNSITGVVYEDFVKPSAKKPWSEAKASALMKVVVVIAGMICVTLVFMVERMGAVIQVNTFSILIC